EAVAVDVVHFGEIEEDLAVSLVEDLLDQAREHFLAHADREPSLEVDDDHVALLASLDVHACGIILDVGREAFGVRRRRGSPYAARRAPHADRLTPNAVNLILLFDDDFVTEARVRLTGRRLRHVLDVHRAATGDELTVGVAGGRVGRGRVVRLDSEALEMDVVLEREPPAPLPLTLVLALPRPKVLN